jgi:hypothetical protein
MNKKIDNRGIYLKTKTLQEVSDRLSLVSKVLEEFREDRRKFEGISHLAKSVSKEMTKENHILAVSDKSLLKRKSAYRGMLEDYIGNSFSQKGREQELQQLLMLEQLKTKDLEKKLVTLTKELSKLSEKHYQLEHATLSERKHGQIDTEDSRSFEILFKVMHMLAGDFIDVDQTGAYDISEVPKRCVLSREEYTEFFEWLETKNKPS